MTPEERAEGLVDEYDSGVELLDVKSDLANAIAQAIREAEAAARAEEREGCAQLCEKMEAMAYHPDRCFALRIAVEGIRARRESEAPDAS